MQVGNSDVPFMLSIHHKIQIFFYMLTTY